jgi:hypothetical protein
MEWFGKFILQTLVGIGQMMFSGFVLTRLWGWFVVVFFGAPVLGFWMAVGLIILATMIWGRFITINKNNIDFDAVFWTSQMYIVLLTAACLFEGWLVHLIIGG